MSVGQNAHRLGTEHDRRAARLGERPQGGRRMERPAANLDGDAVGLLNPSGGLVDGHVVGNRGRRPTRPRRKRVEPQRHRRKLCVQRQVQIERRCTPRMKDGRAALAQRLAQRGGRMERVGRAHQRGDLPEQPLVRLGDLLHIVAFAMGGLVRIEVIDADPIRSRGERSSQRLKGARADRGDDGGDFAVDPRKRGGGVGHLHFVAKLPAANETVAFVDAQHLRDRGAAVPEHRQVFGHALPHQADEQRFNQRQFDNLRQLARVGGRLGAADFTQPCCAGFRRGSRKYRRGFSHAHSNAPLRLVRQADRSSLAGGLLRGEREAQHLPPLPRGQHGRLAAAQRLEEVTSSTG